MQPTYDKKKNASMSFNKPCLQVLSSNQLLPSTKLSKKIKKGGRNGFENAKGVKTMNQMFTFQCIKTEGFKLYTRGNAYYNAKDGYRNLIKSMEAKKGALVNSYIEVWRWTAKFESKNGCGPYNFIKKKQKN